jgi:hypothetical protein
MRPAVILLCLLCAGCAASKYGTPQQVYDKFYFQTLKYEQTKPPKPAPMRGKPTSASYSFHKK